MKCWSHIAVYTSTQLRAIIRSVKQISFFLFSICFCSWLLSVSFSISLTPLKYIFSFSGMKNGIITAEVNFPVQVHIIELNDLPKETIQQNNYFWPIENWCKCADDVPMMNCFTWMEWEPITLNNDIGPVDYWIMLIIKKKKPKELVFNSYESLLLVNIQPIKTDIWHHCV